MNKDFIDSYIQHKIKYLSECASFFFSDYEENFLKRCFYKYFKTYTDTYFYHILGTLDSCNDYGFETIKEELEGMSEEILDDYRQYELAVSNEDYILNRKAIKDMIPICLFICKLDRQIFKTEDYLEKYLVDMLNHDENIKNKLGNNTSKLLYKLKTYYNLKIKVFDTSNFYYKVDIINKLKEDLYLIGVKHNIKYLKSNYKEAFVNRVFIDDQFTIEKIKTLFWELSRTILRKYATGEKIDKYIIIVDDKIFQKQNIDILKMINNPFIKRYVLLGVSFNTYTYHKDVLDYLNFEYACYVDLSHNNDFMDKLNAIDGTNYFKVILVVDYKDNDRDSISNFKCSDEVELFITKED